MMKRLLLTLLLFAIGDGSTLGSQFPDGSRYFEKAPRLQKARTTNQSAEAIAVKYYFTIEVPEDVGESVGKVILRQRTGVEDIRFLPEKTLAFVGTTRSKAEPLSLAAVDYDPETVSFTIEFEDAIPPGTTFSIGLRPRRNPRLPGIYSFGVMVFPPGQNARSLYLGPGRFTIFRGGRGR